MKPSSNITGSIHVSRDTCRRYVESSELEWLEANGCGDFASGTVANVNTRRYHGWYTAATLPPYGHALTLAKLEESVCMAGRDRPLGCNVYNYTTIHPEAHELLEGYQLNPWPTWQWQAFGITVQREILMLHGRQGVAVHYSLQFPNDEPREPMAIELRPLFAWRNYHDIKPRGPEREVRFNEVAYPDDETGWFWHAPHPFGSSGDQQSLKLFQNASAELDWEAEPFWYFDFSYAVEQLRGDPTREDLYSPGEFYAEIDPDDGLTLWFGLEPLIGLSEHWPELREAELKRRRELVVPGREQHPVACQLARAADQFVVEHPATDVEGARQRLAVIAGYPWYTEWPRDSLISLPGLLLSTGCLDDAYRLITSHVELLKDGLLPNFAADNDGSYFYNACDASLLLIRAARQWEQAPGHESAEQARGKLQRELLPLFQEILRNLLNGTHHGIHVDESDGLLVADDPSAPLTWMNAINGPTVITPRRGKPVEVNALWVNALGLVASWSKEAGQADAEREFTSLHEKAAESFATRFWNEERGCLYDVVDTPTSVGNDTLLRPNQLLAIPQEQVGLNRTRKSAIFDAMERLITPFGLRTLAEGEHGFRPRFEGDRTERMESMHQGSVWPWLLGTYIDALFIVGADSTDYTGETTRRRAREVIRPVLESLNKGCIGQLAELYDATTPHHPHGCPAMAWSIAEILRVCVQCDLFDE
jgi:predicted glycogen debranching enzyme